MPIAPPGRPPHIALARQTTSGDAEELGHAARGHAAPVLTSSKIITGAVGTAQLADRSRIARDRRHDVDVHHRRLHDHAGHAVVERGGQRLRVVERDDAGVLVGAGRKPRP
jgi:hypothetical protein